MAQVAKLKRKCLALIASTLLASVLALFLLKQYERYLGAHIKINYLCEPRPVMWIKDETIGYRNKPNQNRKAFGNVVGITNKMGFRSQVDFARQKKSNTLRVFGIGDSVMWGTQVNEEESFLGILQDKLKPHHEHLEVINAGVVGYSTYQEQLFLKEFVVSYEPDIMIVNFCPNDWLPTEDPFELFPQIHTEYLNRLLRGGDYEFSAVEIGIIQDMLSIVRTSTHVWRSFLEYAANPNHGAVRYHTMRRVLLEIPIHKMKQLASEHDIRLLFVFIPSSFQQQSDRAVELDLQDFMQREGVEYIDMFNDLIGHGTPRIDRPKEQVTPDGKFLQVLLPREWDPEVILFNISEWNYLSNRHSSSNYIDDIGHPSRRGNRVIAQRIYEYLQSNSAPQFRSERP